MDARTGRAAKVVGALAGLNGLMAVAAGAFGAHAASDPGVKELLRTGSLYQLVHAAAGMACAALPRAGALPGALLGAGALAFGGSLYLLALTGVRILGVVTPLGGLVMMAGWGVVIFGALRRP